MINYRYWTYKLESALRENFYDYIYDGQFDMDTLCDDTVDEIIEEMYFLAETDEDREYIANNRDDIVDNLLSRIDTSVYDELEDNARELLRDSMERERNELSYVGMRQSDFL